MKCFNRLCFNQTLSINLKQELNIPALDCHSVLCFLGENSFLQIYNNKIQCLGLASRSTSDLGVQRCQLIYHKVDQQKLMITCLYRRAEQLWLGLIQLKRYQLKMCQPNFGKSGWEGIILSLDRHPPPFTTLEEL